MGEGMHWCVWADCLTPLPHGRWCAACGWGVCLAPPSTADSAPPALPMCFGLPLLCSGTSMACPAVSGTVALLWAVNPSADWTEVRAAIMSNVDPEIVSNQR